MLNLKQIADVNQISYDDWIKIRKKGIGGSDAGAICGVNRYKSPISVYLDKIGESIENVEENESIYWGKNLEDIVAGEFSKKAGLKLEKVDAILQHSDYEFIIANIDRLIVDEERGYGVLECKTASEYMKEDWEGGNVPDNYYVQLQHYLAVTGFTYGYLAVLIGGNKFKYYFIERDQDFIENLIKIELNFWNMVKSKTPPAPDGSNDADRIIDLLYPTEIENTTADLSDMNEIIEELDKLKEEQKKIETKRELLEQEIKLKMGSNEKAFIGERKITWKTVNSYKFNTEKFKTENPELYRKYLKLYKHRRFVVR